MKRTKLALGFGLLMVAVALTLTWSQAAARRRQAEQAAYYADLQKRPHWQEAARHFDQQKASAAAILSRADRVQVFRLTPAPGDVKASGGKLLGGVGYAREEKPQDARFAARLARVVLNPKTYELPGTPIKQCYLNPGLAFLVWSGRQFVDVVICFECNELVVLETNPETPVNSIGGWIIGHFTVAGDFEPARPPLVALAKEALPDNPDVQRL